MHQLYILYEHASGFAIFRTTEFEEVAVFLPQVRESILNVSKFRSNVFFVTYQAFKKQKEALQNMKSVAAGELSHDLLLFLENNIPRTKKSKQTVVLGVEEPDLASAISDKLGIKCISSGLVKEAVRGIRFHFYKLVKGFKDEETAIRSQLSLAHNYSRDKLNFDATRQDSMIIENNSFIEKLDRDITVLGKRIRTWYSFHFPELFRNIPHNIEEYIQCVNIIGDRKNMPEDIKEKLIAVLKDSSLVETILFDARNSMGTDISAIDFKNLKLLCGRALSLMNRQQSTVEYIKEKMHHTAPNLSSLLGEMMSSRLIARAGGLEKLAKLPSSTVQILGADKKLFRTQKFRKEKLPISGLLSNCAFMGKAGKRKKGRLARLLANKCSLAARVDCFSKVRNGAFGCKLYKDVEKGIKYIKKIKIEDDESKADETTVQIFATSQEEPLSVKIEKVQEMTNSDLQNVKGGENVSSLFESKDFENSSDETAETNELKDERTTTNKTRKADTCSENESEVDTVCKQVPSKKKSLSKKAKKLKKSEINTNVEVDEKSFDDSLVNSEELFVLDNTRNSAVDIEKEFPPENTIKNSGEKKSGRKRKSKVSELIVDMENQNDDEDNVPKINASDNSGKKSKKRKSIFKGKKNKS